MAAPHISPAPTQVDLAKRAARERALAARAGCDPAWGARLARHVLADLPPASGATVSGYWPTPGEIDLRPLLVALYARGHKVLLPHTPPLGNPLIFREWFPGAEMVRERFGTYRPTGAIGVPDMLFIPLVAFDRSGRRLGYGGGYYDRTLEGLRAARKVLAIGLAFAAQQAEALPATAHDQRLDWIITENGPMECTR